MAEKYLDLGGLSTLWAKIKAAVAKKVEVFEFTPGTTTKDAVIAAINAGCTLVCSHSVPTSAGSSAKIRYRATYTGNVVTNPASLTVVHLWRVDSDLPVGWLIDPYGNWSELSASVGSDSLPVYADGGTLKPITDLQLTKSDESAETTVAVGNSSRRSSAVLYSDANGDGLRAASGDIVKRNRDGDIVVGDGSWLGNYYTPIFLKDGIPTTVIPGNMHVGTADKLGGANVGRVNQPIYLSAGTPKACSATVGSATTPVYMSEGQITACTANFVFGVNGGSASEPVYLNDRWMFKVTSVKPRRHCSKAYVGTEAQASQYALLAHLEPEGASKSAYAMGGMTFRLYITTTGDRFSATVDAWYRRNNNKLGTLKAYIDWAGGRKPSGTNVYVTATDDIVGHETYGRIVEYEVHVKAARYATVMLTIENVNCNTTVNDTSNDGAVYYDNNFVATEPTATATKKVVKL